MSDTARTLREQARECEVNDGWTPEGAAFMYDAADEIDRLRTLIDGLETERTIREAYIQKLERESGAAGEGTK